MCPSHLTKTCETWRSWRSTRAGGVWACTGGGGAKDSKAWWRSEKKEADEGLGTARNSPGRHNVVPNTISAAERPTPSLGVVQSPRRTQGSCWCQRVAHAPGTERILHGTMEPLDHPVGLRVVGRGPMMPDPKNCAQALPEARDKLRATVRGQMGGDPKTGDPVGDEGVGAVGGGGGGHGNGLRPPGGAVQDGEEIFSASGGR